jgi:uncharacterized phage protein (TIGR01671 family)
MREMKFRLWNKDAKVMAYMGDFPDLYIRFHNDGSWLAQDKYNLLANDSFILSSNDGILMQYTGLQDRYGKEIYEGDILDVGVTSIAFRVLDGKVKVADTSGLAEVCYDNDSASFVFGNDNFLYKSIEDGCIESEFPRVVGNVHENPELINEL